MNRKQSFINLCNATYNFYSDLGEQESASKYFIQGKCVACGEPNVDDVHYTYWNACWKPIHKKCKQEYAKEEAYECQSIDANCNDCKFFKPKEKHKGIGSSWRTGECLKDNSYLNLFPDKYIAYAQPNFAQCNNCFRHRRD